MKNLVRFILLFIIAGSSFYYVEREYQFLGTMMQGGMDEEKTSDYIEALRQGMLNGEKSIKLKYTGPGNEVETFVMDALDKAFTVDSPDTSSDYDYMRYKHAASYMNMKGYGSYYTVIYDMEYLESKEQTEQVDVEVKKVLKKLKVDTLKDYKKIKVIHDYIVDHASYDLSTNRNSAYAALLDKSSACQGYASLTYKMMTEAGIPCRIISGKAKGEPHAWNIVKLGDVWYNIDCTWDDPVGLYGKSNMRYEYFLKSNMDFKDHKRDAEYETMEFERDHVMTIESYKKK